MGFLSIAVMSAQLFCMKYRPAAHLHDGTEIRSVTPNCTLRWIVQRHGDDTSTNTKCQWCRACQKDMHSSNIWSVHSFSEVCFGREILVIKHLSVLWIDCIQHTTRETNQRCDRSIMDLNFTAHSGFTLKYQLQNYGTDCFDLWFMCLRC